MFLWFKTWGQIKWETGFDGRGIHYFRKEPANPECNRTPSFNKIAFIFNDKVQCINIGLNSMCATAIRAFIRGLSLRKREARSRLPCLLVSFWVALSENGFIFRGSHWEHKWRARARTDAQTFEWRPRLPSDGREWVARPPGLWLQSQCQEALGTFPKWSFSLFPWFQSSCQVLPLHVSCNCFPLPLLIKLHLEC